MSIYFVRYSFLLSAYGDLSNSDCYQRSIACSRKGFTRHCRDAILPKSHNPHTFPPNEKTALDTRFLHFWWKCEGICSKRSLRNSKRANLFAKRSVYAKQMRFAPACYTRHCVPDLFAMSSALDICKCDCACNIFACGQPEARGSRCRATAR